MDYKKINAPVTTVTRDMIKMSEQTGNVYETICVIGKRANQIAVEMKKELTQKLKDFETNDNNEEIAENREQIEISRIYERLPKPTLLATQEYIEHNLYFSNPAKEKERLDD
ncbi:MAG: DNA-directed RNA polymerase subunit omega [Bacteroides sp.]|nr:DNA-directed RNA polymerase subunit omega [Bacteroides sp.]MBD5307209.1 DNA-directed RNA polymerase subunit omega [Bacteroides sp.]